MDVTLSISDIVVHGFLRRIPKESSGKCLVIVGMEEVMNVMNRRTWIGDN